ncbi:membrane protein insertase YidC [Candidatus Trichorickettsia mobilis]|uniref:membrane protein insertase YidC n=1 Tax=Candidatus Trichorickettsia mobilis TaxID=1346319 RepID=UPI00292EC810|nr:membrane protein insertase YidC [Candidatus Trichorickettsia mobilis]
MNHNITNLIAAIVLSVGIIFGWQHFYEKPKLEKLTASHKAYNQQLELQKETTAIATTNTRAEAITTTENLRVQITSPSLSGSINLKGLRFDDLTLSKYKHDLTPNSKPVELLSPSGSEDAFFVEVGWFSNTDATNLPNSNTQWQTDNKELTPTQAVNLTWTNPEGVEFLVNISMDNDYLFTIKQTTTNNSKQKIAIQYYGLINRNYSNKEKAINILHQGFIGSINSELQEYSYEDIKDKKNHKFAAASINWLGITDKYWLTAFIPDAGHQYNSNLNYAIKTGFEKFQVDFMAPSQPIEPGNISTVTHRLFAGAKKVDLLDKYEQQYNIKLFDRAIDFGWFYILTKPVFNAMSFFYNYVGNFGVSILIVTVIIKLLMFSLANKSYRSMKKIKKLQPEIERIRALYNDDKMRLNKEIMELYKREKASPLSGCLPLFVQIPVFFSIYKVLYVTIEMRHAPFFGWIKDLSAPDPTSIFNLFGLLSFTPPSFLLIGAWPIFMALTMFLQQRMSPEPADPTQAQVMRFMPLIFLVMFSSFPAGLLIYWSWNNILSIIQQYYINKLDKSN